MKKILRLIPVAAVAFTGLAASACSSAFRQPEVQLVGVQPGGIGLRGGSLVARVEVHNPNSFKLKTESVAYNFEILDSSKSTETWVPVTKGVIDTPLEVGGGDRTIVEIPIEFRYDDFGAAARSVMDRGSFRYRISGNVELKDPIRKTIPFKKTDTFSLAIIGR